MYTKIRQYFDIQQKGIHFLNIIDLKWNPETKTLSGFYNEYRTIILNNVGRQNETIHWNENIALAADEIIGPLFEDVILLNVIGLIDPRLPQYVKEYYLLKLGDNRHMDIRTNIFNNVKKFITELDNAEQLNSLCLQTSLSAASTAQSLPTLAAFSTVRGGRGTSQPSRRTFCKTCYDNEKGKTTYLSHSTTTKFVRQKSNLTLLLMTSCHQKSQNS